MSLLESLPGEVVAEAASFFDSETLLSFRLVNKNISSAIDHIILQRFFRHRDVFINSDSLDILRRISISEKHRTSVTSLSVCIHHIPEAQYDFELEDMSSEARSMAASNGPHYTTLLRDQKWLMESGQAAAHLALALKNLPACVNVEVNDQLVDFDRSFQKSEASQLLTTQMTLPASIDFVKRLISFAMAAINASGCMLEDFYIGHFVEGFGIQQLPRLPLSELGLPFSRLPRLGLILGLKVDDIRNDWKAYLLDFLKWFPSLKDLDLSFEPRLTQTQFSLIGKGLHVEGMNTLLLGCMDCHYNDLAVVLKSHRNTLHRVTLDAVDLTGNVKPWRMILELIRDETLIDYMRCMCCTTNERDISFGAHFESGYMSIPTEDHEFREGLEGVINTL